ncbi:hypothetical protein NQ318_001127 [Aromia moschata]|uniref:Uncharacterized protein n=1 Tax=Aromia moschata TaxID=1265417 RepID=A0AAV8ZHH0_9CUCU|nr:hypothetical protein NQ318_001127 [Aromia moschata]
MNKILKNDELYIEKSTTTAAPTVYNFYTVPPRAAPLTPSPAAPGAQLPAPLPPPEPLAPRRQPAMRQRPYQRPRPLYDYYEEDYEGDAASQGSQRRPRPRPVYYDDDDYEDYEESRLPRRSGGRRRPYWRERTSRRKDRRKYDYDEDDYGYEYDDAFTSPIPCSQSQEEI